MSRKKYNKKTKRKRETKRRKQKVDRFASSLSELRVDFVGIGFFNCEVLHMKKPKGCCSSCFKRCSKKKLMIEYWKRYFAEIKKGCPALEMETKIEEPKSKRDKKSKKEVAEEIREGKEDFCTEHGEDPNAFRNLSKKGDVIEAEIVEDDNSKPMRFLLEDPK